MNQLEKFKLVQKKFEPEVNLNHNIYNCSSIMNYFIYTSHTVQSFNQLRLYLSTAKIKATSLWGCMCTKIKEKNKYGNC